MASSSPDPATTTTNLAADSADPADPATTPTPPNPLLSKQSTSSEQHVVLHPIALLTISDYIARHTLRKLDQPLIGGLLGQQNGHEITIEHAFDAHMQAKADVLGGFLLHDKFGERLEQMRQVHKDRQLDLVGWYTLLPPTGPTDVILPIHKQILTMYNESAVLLGFHPTELVNRDPASAGGRLPVTIYESNHELDDSHTAPRDHDTANAKMVADNPTVPAAGDADRSLRLRFRELTYSVETDESEMIAVDEVARKGGVASVEDATATAAAVAAAAVSAASAAAAATPTAAAAAAADAVATPERTQGVVMVEGDSRGKRRIISAEKPPRAPVVEEVVVLNSEENEMIAALTAKANAIRMMHARIQLITAYLERLPADFVVSGGVYVPTTAGEVERQEEARGEGRREVRAPAPTTPSHILLRQIKALVGRLDLVVPSDAGAFRDEMLREQNDVNLVAMMDELVRSVDVAWNAGRKLGVLQAARRIVPPADLGGSRREDW